MPRTIILEKKQKIINFYFDGDEWRGVVNSVADITDLYFFYGNKFLNTKVREKTVDSEVYMISFGFRRHYDGELTLGEWIKINHLEHFFSYERE